MPNLTQSFLGLRNDAQRFVLQFAGPSLQVRAPLAGFHLRDISTTTHESRLFERRRLIVLTIVGGMHATFV